MSLNFYINGEYIDGSDKSFTLVDPGGCETATISVRGDKPQKPGSDLLITDGTQRLFQGYVEEPGVRARMKSSRLTIGGVGVKTALGRGRMAMIYIDRRLSEWSGSSMVRRQQLSAGAFDALDPVIPIDGATPGIRTFLEGPWSRQGECDAWYDAGPNCMVSKIVALWTRGTDTSAADPNWTWSVLLVDGESVLAGTFDSAGNLRAAGPAVVSLLASTSTRRYAVIQQYFANVAAGGNSVIYPVDWTGIQVRGPHSLTERTAADGNTGFYASDIVADVLERSGFVSSLDIELCTVIVQNLAYKSLVPHQQIIDDLVKYTGWHFGVWPSESILDTLPVAKFQAPPSVVTAQVRYDDLVDPDLTERFSGMNRQVNVTYSLVNGQQTSILLERDHPRLEAGKGGTLDVDVGMVGNSDVAEVYGLYALALDQVASRVSGSITLPPRVQTPNGGYKLSHYLRPGIDRLRILGLPADDSLLDGPPKRVDSFRISRLTVSEQNGSIVTVAELDQGADLIEVLQARFSASDPTGSLSSG